MLKTKQRRAAEVRLLLRTGQGSLVNGGGGAAATGAAEECPICLEFLTPENTASLVNETGEYACRHNIHRECAEKLEEKLCPTCRVEFVDTSMMPTNDEVCESAHRVLM